MNRLLLITIGIIAVSAAVLGSYKEPALGVTLTSGESEDLCGGTGGIGQIVSVGDGAFTIKRNDSSNNQIVHLSDQATIKTSAGLASLSDLKSGEKVTLVGGPNRDGSFTADFVLVCNGIQENKTDQAAPPIERKVNPNFKKVNFVIKLLTILLFGLVWLGTLIFLRLKKKKNHVYLLFYTIFYIYLYKVLDYTLIQFQSLLLIQHFVPGLMLNGFRAGTNINLIPLVTLPLKDVKTSLLNILMMMPFGFGLPFITNFNFKKVVFTGALVSVIIEFLQWITGFAANTTFRVADINDVIFNSVGVVIGYFLFVVFLQIFRASSNQRISTNPIMRYIAERPQMNYNARKIKL